MCQEGLRKNGNGDERRDVERRRHAGSVLEERPEQVDVRTAQDDGPDPATDAAPATVRKVER